MKRGPGAVLDAAHIYDVVNFLWTLSLSLCYCDTKISPVTNYVEWLSALVKTTLKHN